MVKVNGLLEDVLGKETIAKRFEAANLATEIRRFIAARINSAETRSFIEEPLTSTYRYRGGQHPS